MTRAIVFDVDGVLLHGFHARPDQRESWDKILGDLGIDADRFQTEFIFDIFLKKVLTGQTPMIEALDKRLPGLGYKGSSMAFAQIWLNHENQPNVELLSALRKLKGNPNLKLFLATNQDHMRAQWLWETLGLGEIFEDIFYSGRIGLTKAHRGFFDFADQRMRLPDVPPLFFDDTAKVIEVARSHGWEAVHFSRNEDVFNHEWLRSKW